MTAFWAISEQPWDDKYDYGAGWHACADARWQRNPTTGSAEGINHAAT
jgi:hypothetical protein